MQQHFEMDTQFVKAQSDDIPKINASMMAVFYKQSDVYTAVEIRGTKAER